MAGAGMIIVKNKQGAGASVGAGNDGFIRMVLIGFRAKCSGIANQAHCARKGVFKMEVPEGGRNLPARDGE